MTEDIIVTWQRMRAELKEIYIAAEANNDAATMKRADELAAQADKIMLESSLKTASERAAEVAAIQEEIDKASAAGKQWSPFKSIEDELRRSFRGDIADNDHLDAGPNPPDSIPLQPNDNSNIPVVSAGWSANYQSLWETMTISDSWKKAATGIVTKLVKNQGRYAAVVEGTTIPWWFVGVIHSMESDMNFATHLHNGDSLENRTVHFPPNRPVVPDPPYAWEVSATDSIHYERLDQVTDWSLPSVLYHWHRYNGIVNEYKRRGIPTPYLWSGSQHYSKGLYVRDHVFDPDRPSDQVGAAVLLKTMIDMRVIEPFETDAQLISNPKAAAGELRALQLNLKSDWASHAHFELKVPSDIGYNKRDKGKKLGVRRLQEWLTVAEFETPIDGVFLNSTQEQSEKFRIAHGRRSDAPLDEEIWSILTAPMLRALSPVGFSSSTSLEDAVLRVAIQHVVQKPRGLGGNNKGPWVRLYMEGSEGDDLNWSAGFVCFIVLQAAKELGLDMPFDRKILVNDLVCDAKKAGRFVAGSSLESPAARRSRIKPGSLFVIRDGINWSHVGIVLRVNDTTIDTLEGNSGGEAGIGGANARSLNRSFDGKDFINLF
ncbi:hypothetical protein CO665_30995 [Rhizobium anhuiense]|uniref:hypothetical protein n=1 Tax=Rhizobium anhuiense TaxID=1184720 RepID=UPI000BEA3A71|nr:hypothetical protein [Rhizobium anhuiense]PDS34460.1 hypothetical protein CO665_30995 [Rhizobium anhuiense]